MRTILYPGGWAALMAAGECGAAAAGAGGDGGHGQERGRHLGNQR